ncbi:MAG: CapA family protein [Pseudomonadota bacterium]
MKSLVLVLLLLLPLSLRAESTGLTGRVVDTSGQPLADVIVQLEAVHGTPAPTASAEPRPAARAVTGADGVYVFDNVEGTHVRLRFTGDCCFAAVHTLRLADWPPAAHQHRGAAAQQTNTPILQDVVLVHRQPGRVMLAFAGDTMLARRYFDPLPGEPQLIRPTHVEDDARQLLKLVTPYLQLADFTSVNLETVLLEGEIPEPLEKSVTFYSPPGFAQVLREVGVDYVALGNNHTYDFRADGLARTLQALRTAGLGYSGAGLTEQTARQGYPFSPSRPGAKMAAYDFRSYVGWAGTFDPHQAAEGDKGGAALGSLRNLQMDMDSMVPSDLVANAVAVVQYHGGLEYQAYPTLLEQTRLRGAVDAGADLVLGHHPHVLQGFELYNGRLIAYSLGNFLFDQYIYGTQLTMLLYVWMDGDQLHRAEIVPLYLNGYVPTPATGAIRYDILQRQTRLTDKQHLQVSPSGAHLQLSPAEIASASSIAVDVGNRVPGEVHSLQTLGVLPWQLIRSVRAGNVGYRLGVDLLKRGSFSHWQEYGTPSRTWLQHAGMRVQNTPKGHGYMLVQGSALTGMRVFERAFRPSTPATVQASVRSATAEGCHARLAFDLQRRNLTQPWLEALRDGASQRLGSVMLGAGEVRTVTFDFNMPRTATKGVRLLVKIEQPDHCVLQLDDLLLVEWQSAWLSPNSEVPDAGGMQATHLQLMSFERMDQRP